MATDKDRENYLGHSVFAPAGRWTKGRDPTWYNKDKAEEAAEARRQEMKKIKQAEEDALGQALYVLKRRSKRQGMHIHVILTQYTAFTEALHLLIVRPRWKRPTSSSSRSG